MARGKRTCKILKEIRRQIARANNIDFDSPECGFKGDCLGSCPKCDDEVRYLDEQIRKRQLAGKRVNLAGISAGMLAMFAPLVAQSTPQEPAFTLNEPEAHSTADMITVKGIVLGADSISNDTLIGVGSLNLRTEKRTYTDRYGVFEIEALPGDSLRVWYISYITQDILIADDSPVEILMQEDNRLLYPKEIIMGAFPQKVTDKVDIYLYDEQHRRVKWSSVVLELVYTDNKGRERTRRLGWTAEGDNPNLTIHWNEERETRDKEGNPLEKITLRITAPGLAQKTVLLERPNRYLNRVFITLTAD